jgi:hypothetical protein
VPIEDDLVDKLVVIVAMELPEGDGLVTWMSLRAAKVQRWALLRREYKHIHPEGILVAVKERIY